MTRNPRERYPLAVSPRCRLLLAFVPLFLCYQLPEGLGQHVFSSVPLQGALLLLFYAVAVLVGSLLDDPAVWIPRALVVLVAAAPCAFALSVPIAVVAAVGAASKAGVLIKGGAHLEALGSIRSLALDKTGTITEGAPKVQELIALGGAEEERLVRLAASIDAHSDHPLALAICAFSSISTSDAFALPATWDTLSHRKPSGSTRLGT